MDGGKVRSAPALITKRLMTWQLRSRPLLICSPMGTSEHVELLHTRGHPLQTISWACFNFLLFPLLGVPSQLNCAVSSSLETKLVLTLHSSISTLPVLFLSFIQHV